MTNLNFTEQLRDLKRKWFRTWGYTMDKAIAAKFLYAAQGQSKMRTLWPDEFKSDYPGRVEFLSCALDEAKAVADTFDRPVEDPETWMFSGLFKGSRWLYIRTMDRWGSEIHRRVAKSVPMPKRFDDLLVEFVRKREEGKG